MLRKDQHHMATKNLKLGLCLLLAPIMSHGANEEAPVYSRPRLTAAHSYQEGNILLGYLINRRGAAPVTKILDYDYKVKTFKEFELPSDLENREVLNLFPSSDKYKIFVLTQWVSGDGDNPILSRWDMEKNKWEKLHELVCPFVEDIKVDKENLNYICVDPTEQDKDGNEKKTKHFIKVKDLQAPQIADKNIKSFKNTGSTEENLKVLGKKEFVILAKDLKVKLK